MSKRVLKNILKNGNEYEVGNIKLYVITEDIVSVSTDATKGVSPYNTSYGYTNITIDEKSGIKWKEGAVYAFVINTEMVVASAYRNIRVRIGTNGTYIPVMNAGNSIMDGSSYFTKSRTDLYVYKTTNQSGGALHMNNDTSYSAMSVAEGKTGTATNARTVRADYLKQIIEYHAGNLHDSTKQDVISDLETIRSGAALGATALQSESDPTVPSHVKNITTSDISSWNGKQDAISDLSTIRNNASAGASAATTIEGYGDIVTHNASEFYPSSNPNGYTSNTGTITGITMNGDSKGTSGVADLGTVITEHQDISGKANTADVLTKTNTTAFTPTADYHPATKKYVDEHSSSSGSVDHLEESALIGELYTSNDNLFKQYTPTLANSTVDCPVSNVSANTQIHIQRLGSGVASNQLKLKVKMVGTSTQNLKVEVRRGTQVTVTAGVMAYWYGNEVIASGSIAYTDISSTYTEKTITLNGNFGGTKGELLDIVVYMDTVDGSNYYCIACDSTQKSEGFNYISVNGNTRTRNGLMPYGISDGFANSMLVKTTSTELYPSGSVIDRKENISGYIEFNSRSRSYVHWFCLGSFTNNTDQTVSVKARGKDLGYLYSSEIRIGRSTSDYYTTYNVYKPAPQEFETWSVNVPAGETWSWFICDTGADGGATVTFEYFEIIINQDLTITTDKKTFTTEIIGQLAEVMSIGSEAGLPFYGIVDGEMVGGLMLEKVNTATSGSIALGNAVGYIKVNLNGEIIKIPYYNE